MKKLLLLFALVLTICCTAMAENLTMESPVGTVGTLDGREAMVVDLGGTIGKVAIATKNVGATDANDSGTLFTIAEANDPSKTGLTDDWYIPTYAEMGAMMGNLTLSDDGKMAEWKVTETSILSIPFLNVFETESKEYSGYANIANTEEGIWKYYMPQLVDDALSIEYILFTEVIDAKFLIRPFHKLPVTYIDADGVSYVYPVYNAPNNVTKGIEKWETGKVFAIEVASSTEPVTWGEAGKTTWYVVNGKDVQLTQGAVCVGDVHLILADDAKLTANGGGNQAGIQVSGEGNSLTIYGQANQSGQLEANGDFYAAGIGGGNQGNGNDITINGGIVTAKGKYYGAGIGGGFEGNGSNITINGGMVTATGEHDAAAIGGGYLGNGFYITINDGTVTASADGGAAAIGGGQKGLAGSIYVSASLRITAGDFEDIAEEIGWYRDYLNWDLGTRLAGLRYVAIEPAPAPAPVSVTYIDENGEEKTANAYEIDKNMPFPAALGTDNTTSWFVVTGKDVQFKQGAECHGNVHLILADGAKLTATGVERKAGIQAMFLCNSITIYGQSNQSGQLIANGVPGKEATLDDTSTIPGSAGISGNFVKNMCNFTINGGTITANGGVRCAGIGGIYSGNSDNFSNITINGGTVTAKGGENAAGIGGGDEGSGSNITINGGTVTAKGGKDAASIGGGGGRGTSSNIFVSPVLTVKVDNAMIENTGGDLAGKLGNYVTITDAVCNITANQDPNNTKHYYSTFYSGKKAYGVPEGVTAYTGVVDGSVLKLKSVADGIIPKGEAVILRLTTTDNTATSKQIVLEATTATATKSSTNALKGSDYAKPLGANDYALSYGTNGVGFYLWNGKSIGAHKAYLHLDEQAAKVLIFDFDGDITGIEETIRPQNLKTSQPYNLNGVRVNEGYKGIVIKNGKKFYQK